MTDSHPIPYTLERKSIKNLYLRIYPDGSIHVTAPRRMPLSQIEAFLVKKEDWIRKHQENVMHPAALDPALSSFLPLPAMDREALRAKLSLQIPVFLKKWEPVMKVHALEWRIRDMHTRWGTCNVRDKRIWIAQALGAYPEECLEYVIVHELCHLLEPSHNAVFHQYMTRFLPDWKERKDLLNALYKASQPR